MSTHQPDADTAPRERPASLPGPAAAMARALDLAARGPAHGPNPRVGCVLLAPPRASAAESSRGDASAVGGANGDASAHAPREVLGEGYHRGSGHPHAEIEALEQARSRGVDVRGATAVVTLEPCTHTGRTPPCYSTLVEAGIAEVVYAVTDPNRQAAGGAELLRAHGVRTRLLPDPRADELIAVWATAVRRGTPFVTLKLATTLDGRVAAADGSSQWITSATARAHAHAVRREIDAIAVGTGTVYADDPSLTARDASDEITGHQPLRVVVGRRPVPVEARLHGPGGELVPIATHDVRLVLAELGGREVRHLLVEGGPTLATAFLRADAVDELHVYSAPLLLGAGTPVVGDLGIGTLDDGRRWRTEHVERLGDDVLLIARRNGTGSAPLDGDQLDDEVFEDELRAHDGEHDARVAGPISQPRHALEEPA